MEISPEKSETMAILVQDPARCKIIVDKRCLQVNIFKYLSCEISYENEKDIPQKVAKFAQILQSLNNTFQPTLVQKFSRINVFLALPTLLYGSEICTFIKRDKTD